MGTRGSCWDKRSGAPPVTGCRNPEEAALVGGPLLFLQKTGRMNKITLIYAPVYSILEPMVSVLASAGHKNGRRAKELGNELRD